MDFSRSQLNMPSGSFKGKLLFRKTETNNGAILPVRAHEDDAGVDICSIEDLVITPHGRRTVQTGLSVSFPKGHYMRVAPRSGIASKNGIDVGAGVIDHGYQGPIGVVLFNHGSLPFEVTKGMKIAQLILEQISTLEPEWADEEIKETSRGNNGFGSSG